ncbi:hypothetical protein [Halobacteriovorax sp.]|uniref:hypothetical protein n=1 Tax=Halobacteriovorax sp. TaxID=2020862 RepID=UPI003568AD69
MNIKFLITYLVLITNVSAFWGNRYEKFQDNVPVDYIKSEQGRCDYFIIDKNDKQQTYVATRSYISKDNLESTYCERMFAKTAKDFFLKEDKSSPAELNNYDYAYLVPASDVKDLEFKTNHYEKSKVITTKIIRSSENTNSSYSTIESIKARRTGSPRGIPRLRDYYRVFTLNHAGFHSTRDGFNITEEFLTKSNDWDEILEFNIKAKNLWDDLVEELGETKARIFYFDNNALKMNKKKRKYLHDKISFFHIAIRGYLESANIYDTGGLSLVQNFHPLFVQVLLENTSSFNLFFENELHNYHEKSLILDLLKYMMLIPKDDVTDDLGFNEQLSMEALIFRNNRLKSYINTLILLNMTEEKCSSFGLWPGASRWIHLYRSSQIGTSFDVDPIDHLVRRVEQKTIKSCGDFTPYKRFNMWGGEPMKNWEIGMKKKKKDFKEIYNKLLIKYSFGMEE